MTNWKKAFADQNLIEVEIYIIINSQCSGDVN